MEKNVVEGEIVVIVDIVRLEIVALIEVVLVETMVVMAKMVDGEEVVKVIVEIETAMIVEEEVTVVVEMIEGCQESGYDGSRGERGRRGEDNGVHDGGGDGDNCGIRGVMRICGVHTVLWLCSAPLLSLVPMCLPLWGLDAVHLSCYFFVILA